MALDTFVAGAYIPTYDSVSVGLVESGYNLLQAVKGEAVRGDYYGESMLDGVFRGADVSLEYVSIAYKAGSIAAMWPFGTLGEHPTPGQLLSDLASQTVLTATTGTPAETSGPASITASRSIIPPDHQSRMNLSAMLRKMPVRLQLLPYVSGVTRWYIQA